MLDEVARALAEETLTRDSRETKYKNRHQNAWAIPTTKIDDDMRKSPTSTQLYSTTTYPNLKKIVRIFSTMRRNGIVNISTPKKARIRGAADFNDAMGISYYHSDLFRFYGVSHHQGWAILKEGIEEEVPDDLPQFSFDRTHHNNHAVEERRGRKPKLSPKQLEQADRFLQDVGWEARILTHLGSMDYHKCVACTKG
ncbi:hypothetical protein BKA66DRAFT_477760 [Pyrenochaeta sp. MPI-SDFR-AT-0127]|nr:hypothetical protein BKA66DRAFT_477760 [Pyrenochaeta sp. MPI-SDFR-AT-0127]